MKRQLVPFILGFLVALVAAMSATVMGAGRDAASLHPLPDSLQAPEVDSTGTNSATAAETPRPAGIGVPAMLDVADVQPPAALEAVRDDSAQAGTATAASRAPAVAATSGQAPVLSLTRDSTAIVYERRLARTFGAMSPRDAARVLEQMSDADIGTVLSYLNERQSAGILSSLPPTRAARLGELVLRNQESN